MESDILKDWFFRFIKVAYSEIGMSSSEGIQGTCQSSSSNWCIIQFAKWPVFPAQFCKKKTPLVSHFQVEAQSIRRGYTRKLCKCERENVLFSCNWLYFRKIHPGKFSRCSNWALVKNALGGLKGPSEPSLVTACAARDQLVDLTVKSDVFV